MQHCERFVKFLQIKYVILEHELCRRQNYVPTSDDWTHTPAMTFFFPVSHI